MDSFEHEQSTAQVAIAVSGNSALQTFAASVSFFLAHLGQDLADLIFSRSGDSDKQGPAPDRGNDVACAVGQEDQAKIGAVFFHGSSQRGLSVSGEVIGLVDDNDLEALFGCEVDLLCLGDFFQQVLDDDSIVVGDIAGRDLEVVVGRYDVKFKLAIAGHGQQQNAVCAHL